MDNEINEVYKMLGELSGTVSEDVGDNTVDNMMTELYRSSKIELGKFVGSLLNANLNRFLQSYNLPEYEPFRNVMRNIISRYQVMSGSEQGDLFVKIEGMFKDIFVSQYGHLGPEIAELIAVRYAVQMIQFIKQYGVAGDNLSLDKDSVYY